MLKLRICHDHRDVADLFLSKRLLRGARAEAPATIAVTSHWDTERQRVEAFIKDNYARHFGARVSVTYPLLMSVRDSADGIRAAVGFRPAGGRRLFLETYLDQPIEAAIAAAASGSPTLRRPIQRRDIVEVGNLASRGDGAALILYIALATFLHNDGYHIVAATGSRVLSRQFRMVGIETSAIAQAPALALGPAAQLWGSYYESDPRVLFGAIAPGVAALRQAFDARYRSRPSPAVPRPRFAASALAMA